MGNSNSTNHHETFEEYVIDLNTNLVKIPKDGIFLIDDFKNNSEKIKESQLKLGLSLEDVDNVLQQIDILDNLKNEDESLKLDELLCKISNSIVEQNHQEFWTKIYNLLILDKLLNHKFSFMGKSLLKEIFFTEVNIPEDFSYNQLNVMFNKILKFKEIKNIYQLYIEDEASFSKLLLNHFYTSDHIFTGLTHNLSILNDYSDAVKNVILMHILINNHQDFMGPFRYNTNRDDLLLPKSINESIQYQSISNFEDSYSLITFTCSEKMSQLSFIYQQDIQEFIGKNTEYFKETHTLRNNEELGKKNKELVQITQNVENIQKEKEKMNQEDEVLKLEFEKIDQKLIQIKNDLENCDPSDTINEKLIKLEKIREEMEKMKKVANDSSTFKNGLLKLQETLVKCQSNMIEM